MIRLLLVDDDPLVRAGLAWMLGGTPGVEIVGEASDGAEALRAVREKRPDVVLMDIRMPNLDGLTATERLRRTEHPPEVIVLTTFDTDEHLLRALRVGAAGFLLKDTPPPRIVEAVRAVAAGEPMLSPSVVRQLIARVVDADAGPRRERARRALEGLSGRERDVALAVARGWSNARIGDELHLSVPTVKAHVSRVLTKLGVENRVQIALLARDAEPA
ncbi:MULTISPECIES: response regulator transcription factor [Actinosynnema]|uniref:response regulator transcription factor n=1 Tax=Actinosynnema TaxID=40566 RepID=UPI0020A54923|nr:response regulator transcription factor [Actinosynnema pretiosum]MCP2097162.1 two component transcriptional regulator, LuxR family [Actinosynnema pretiosum]